MNFLYDYNTFLIKESIKQAKNYIHDKNLNGEKELSQISEILKKNNSLIFNFIKYHFEENVPIFLTPEEIKEMELDGIKPDYRHSIDNFSKHYQKYKQQLKNYLPQDIIKYDTFESLVDDIDKAQDDITIKKFVKPLKGDLRRDFDYNDSEMKTLILTYLSEIENKNIKPEDKPIPLSSFYEMSSSFSTFDDLKRFFEKELNKKEGVSEYENNVRNKLNTVYKDTHDIIYDKKGILIIAMFDKDGIKKLGGNWCIANNQTAHYNSYCNPVKGWTQYLAFNFNKLKKDPNSLYGVSISEDGSTIRGGHQNRNNSEIPMDIIAKDLGVSVDIFKPIYKGLKDKYGDLNIDSYDEFKKIMKEIEKDGYGVQLKNLIADNFQFSTFARNMLKKSKNWTELFSKIKKIDDEIFSSKTEASLIREASKYDNLIQYIKHYSDFETSDPKIVSEIINNNTDIIKNIPNLFVPLIKGLGLTHYLYYSKDYLIQITNNTDNLNIFINVLDSKIESKNSINNTLRYLEKLTKESTEDKKNSIVRIIQHLIGKKYKSIVETFEDTLNLEDVKIYIKENISVIYMLLCLKNIHTKNIHKNILINGGIEKHSELLKEMKSYFEDIGIGELYSKMKKETDIYSIYIDYFVSLGDIPIIYEESQQLSNLFDLKELLNSVFKKIIDNDSNMSIDKMEQLITYTEKINDL